VIAGINHPSWVGFVKLSAAINFHYKGVLPHPG
jgi:hypothetical protein